ncbi:MAG TPA: GGDEF domain-containing protein [Planctomycetaceae bacterium]|jgi:diguanylate cyclase
MTPIAAFAIAALFVCLGFAAGAFLTRRGTADKVTGAGSTTSPPAAGAESVFEIRGDRAAEFLDRIHKLTANVDSDVDRHATRVAAISGELAGDADLSATAAGTAAAQLLEANRQLQHDLETAKEELQVQRRQLDSYMAEALTDALTGLANRRKFDQELNRRFAQWKGGGTPLSLVLVDVDHFKSFNDEHGHVAGDAILHEVAHVLLDNVRANDLVARYGGEEFGIILPGTTLEEARPIAERIRGSVASHTFQFGDAETAVTVSAGVAQAILTNDSEVLVTRADTALYAAKDSGRDCCHVHDGQGCVPVAKTSSANRRKSDSSQRIAPFIDGRFPDADMFSNIDCEEVSQHGFTFLTHEPPEYDKVLLALGDGRTRAYASASVKSTRNIGAESDPLYRVACQFTVPVDRFAETALT